MYFWLDNWLGYRLVDRLGIDEIFHSFLRDRVSAFRENDDWCLTPDFVAAFPDVVDDIRGTVISSHGDERLWKGSLHGDVTSKVMRLHTRRRFMPINWGTWI